MDNADYLSKSQRNLRSQVETFADEIEGTLERYSVCGVHLTRKVVCGALAGIVLLSVIIGVSVGTTSNNAEEVTPGLQNGAGVPTEGDEEFTKDHRYWSLGETLESSIGGEALFEEGTPENQALRWLADSDPQQLPVTVRLEELLERFLMANFYFATNGFKWKNSFNFLSEKDVCDWNEGSAAKGDFRGVMCKDDGKIILLDFSDNGLSGSIPEDIGLLTNAEQFIVKENEIEGTLPASFGIMREIELIDLSNNKIHGVFPQSMAMMKKLKIAKFSNNEIAGFDGIGIWKQLPMLEEMELNNNKITGFVGDWGDIPNLVLLDVSNNQITGTIPEKFGEDLNLRSLSFSNNQIKGSLPASFLQDLPDVRKLDLSNNLINGPIPSTINEMGKLEELYLNGNDIGGDLPQDIASLPVLTNLDISGTKITGSLDEALCGRSDWQVLQVDCLSEDTTCSCATDCCNSDEYCCDMTGQTACEIP